MFRGKTEDSRRQVILHYHIFKNAGTTVESILKNNFRARFASFDSDDYNSTVSNEALLEFLAVHSEVVAITSHHLRPPKPVDDHFVFHDILFLRHPVARLWSTYEFYRRSDLETDPLAGAAKTRSAQEFFQLLTEDYPYHANNAQVNLLANAGGRLPIESDLPRAAEAIRQATVVGVAELFDESVQLERLQRHCGTEVFDRIMRLNQLDLALIETACSEVSRRFHLVPDRARRLKILRSRCAAQKEAVARTIIASNHPAAFASYASPGSA